jgi:hypothetical protein
MWMRARRAELTQHVGGQPSAVERQLIERAVRLGFQLELMDAKLARGDEFTEHDHRVYLAWSNSLGRTLRLLGLKPAGAGRSAASLNAQIGALRRNPAPGEAA